MSLILVLFLGELIQSYQNSYVVAIDYLFCYSWGYLGRLHGGGHPRIMIWPSPCPPNFLGPTLSQSAGEVFSSCFPSLEIHFHWHRYLATAGPDLLITDYGLGKVNKEFLSFSPEFPYWNVYVLQVYNVNRDGSGQTAFGYLGMKEGQLHKPAGILLDDRCLIGQIFAPVNPSRPVFLRGNVMVSDSENHRLQVFSAAGNFVKVVATFPSKPFGLIRWLFNRVIFTPSF